MKITYKKIPGFRGYVAGSDGSIWSRKLTTGRLRSKYKRMRPSTLRNGYLLVCLSKNCTRHYRLVHRLILETFVGPCPPKHQARHFPDRTVTNNCLTNLSWGTKKQNEDDKLTHQTLQRGETHGGAKLTEAIVRAIRKSKKSQSQLARQYGISQTNVSAIIRRVSWTHVS